MIYLPQFGTFPMALDSYPQKVSSSLYCHTWLQREHGSLKHTPRDYRQTQLADWKLAHRAERSIAFQCQEFYQPPRFSSTHGLKSLTRSVELLSYVDESICLLTSLLSICCTVKSTKKYHAARCLGHHMKRQFFRCWLVLVPSYSPLLLQRHLAEKKMQTLCKMVERVSFFHHQRNAYTERTKL